VEASPNPWLPAEHAAGVELRGIPPQETATIRIFSAGGELVYEDERPGSVDFHVWKGTNLGGNLVESGVYFVTAVSSDGTRRTYEGKVAVIR